MVPNRSGGARGASHETDVNKPDKGHVQVASRQVTYGGQAIGIVTSALRSAAYSDCSTLRVWGCFGIGVRIGAIDRMEQAA